MTNVYQFTVTKEELAMLAAALDLMAVNVREALARAVDVPELGAGKMAAEVTAPVAVGLGLGGKVHRALYQKVDALLKAGGGMTVAGIQVGPPSSAGGPQFPPAGPSGPVS